MNKCQKSFQRIASLFILDCIPCISKKKLLLNHTVGRFTNKSQYSKNTEIKRLTLNAPKEVRTFSNYWNRTAYPYIKQNTHKQQKRNE